MSDFGSTPSSNATLGANEFPVSAVYVPNTAGNTLTPLQGGTPSTDTNDKTSAPMRVESGDGSDFTQGAKADAGVIGDSAGTVSAKLRGINKIFADVWDSVNHWFQVKVMNFPATQAISAASLTLPSGAATSARQPAPSIAGTPSADVLSVQGVAGMTPLKTDGSATTQPVSAVSDNLTEVNGTTIIANTADAVAGTGVIPVVLYTFNGTAYDRVRSSSSGGNQGVIRTAIAATDGTGLQAQNNLSDNMGGLAGLGTVSFPALWNGNGWDRQRSASVFKPVKAVSVTAGTPVLVWTPAIGKKFRVMGYALSLSVAGSIIFEDTTGAGNEFLRTPLLAAGVGQNSPNIGNGYLSLAANNALYIDVSASGTISGYVYGTEE